MFLTPLKKLAPLLWLVLSLSAWPVLGEDRSPLTIRGFGTLGLAQSTSDDVEFIRNISQPNGLKKGQWSGRTDSILGVQANWHVSPALEFAGQVVSRYKYNGSRDPEVVWAYAKWMPDDRLSLRAGRIGSDLLLMADSQLVGYSYLNVRPANDVFGLMFFSYIDGADASLTVPLGNGLIRSKLFAGVIGEKVPGINGIWDTSGSTHYGLVVDYFTGVWQFRASAASVRFSNGRNFESLINGLNAAAALTGITAASSAADELVAKNTHTNFYSLGVVYDEGPLQIQAALNSIIHQTGSLQNSTAGYLLAGYRINQLTPYAGISRWKSNYKNNTTGLPDIPLFASLNKPYQAIMDGSTTSQTTYTLGLRWDIRANIALKFQWDAIHANDSATFPYATGSAKPGWNGRTDVFSTTMDFIF